ncbi:MAG: hypothetical protein AB2L11_07550 [Syntrophobacteraceae bacterium]
MLQILVLAALPDEYRPLRRFPGKTTLLSKKPFRSFVAFFHDIELTIVETGMGGTKANRALHWQITRQRPDLLCSIGFAGGLSESMNVGDVFLGTEFRIKEYAADSMGIESLSFEPSIELDRFCCENGIHKARVISVDRAQPKDLLAALSGGGEALVDMESYFAASFAAHNQIPFLCFRAVSDALGDEIDFDLDAIMDPEGCVHVLKVLLATFRKPRLVKSFYYSWRRSVKASQNLNRVLAKLLMLPAPILLGLTSRSA